tara:strand:- start:32 stop:739 length:708 start_codon:yes stop_codon:yes gene_type:complete
MPLKRRKSRKALVKKTRRKPRKSKRTKRKTKRTKRTKSRRRTKRRRRRKQRGGEPKPMGERKCAETGTIYTKSVNCPCPKEELSYLPEDGKPCRESRRKPWDKYAGKLDEWGKPEGKYGDDPSQKKWIEKWLKNEDEDVLEKWFTTGIHNAKLPGVTQETKEKLVEIYNNQKEEMKAEKKRKKERDEAQKKKDADWHKRFGDTQPHARELLLHEKGDSRLHKNYLKDDYHNPNFR